MTNSGLFQAYKAQLSLTTWYKYLLFGRAIIQGFMSESDKPHVYISCEIIPKY